MREWLKLMLEEIRRREAEEAAARGPDDGKPDRPQGQSPDAGSAERGAMGRDEPSPSK